MSKKTIVEEGTHFRGALSSNCPVVVNGKIEGEVETPALEVSATGSVKGQVKVGEVNSQGEIEGEFDADTIRLAGTVRDKTVLRTKSLEVKLATDGKMQVVFGNTELSVGDEPSDSPQAAAEETGDDGGDSGGGGRRKKRGRRGGGGDDDNASPDEGAGGTEGE